MGYSKKKHLQDNILAIQLAFELEKRGDKPTSDEIEILRRYSGFGGLKCILHPCYNPEDIDKWSKSDQPLFEDTQRLYDVIKEYSASDIEFKNYKDSLNKSVLSAFYTPTEVTKSIADSLSECGINPVRILDPSAGTGAFLDGFIRYSNLRFTCFEKDLITGKILKVLHNDAKVYIRGFETLDKSDENYFDLVTSNIPFGDFRIFDEAFLKDTIRQQACSSIHNYFFLKAVDAAREGGLIAFITSQGVMDSVKNSGIRQRLMSRCNLLTAIRLPDNLFLDIANTCVGSDLIILQKNTTKQSVTSRELAFTQTRTFPNGVSINNYYTDFSRVIHTKAQAGKDQYGKPSMEFYFEKPMNELADELSRIIKEDCRILIDKPLFTKHQQVEKKEQEKERPKSKPKVIAESIGEPEPLISLYDLFGIPEEERTQISRKQKTQSNHKQPGSIDSDLSICDITDPLTILENSKEPRPYNGDIADYFKNKTLVFEKRQAGYLTYKKERDENDEFKTIILFNPIEVNAGQIVKIKDYISLRDAYLQLYLYESDKQSANPNLREELNKHYKEFTDKHGDLNVRDNYNVLSLDVFGPEIMALEYFESGYKKLADIFTEPVCFESEKSISADTADEALALSLNEYGYVNLRYMSGVSGLEEHELITKLSSQIYYNPLSSDYEISANFIAGDVIAKVEAIEEYIESNPEEEDIELSKISLEALRKAIPEAIAFTDLDFNLGERWMPAKYYSQYASEIFNTEVQIDYYVDIDNFNIAATDPRTIEIREKYAIKLEDHTDINGLTLLNHALVNTTPKITKGTGKYNVSGNEIRIPDVEAIQQANSKIDEIRSGFTDWLNKQSIDTKNSLADLYNRKFNARVIPKYDGLFQTFPGLHLKELGIKKPYDSQYNSVWQGILNEGVIVDNSVGTGKSLTMCILAHELKRLKIVNKPLLVCLKTNVTAIADHFTKAYPTAKILFPSENDFKKHNRKKLFFKMQNSNWDAIILTHEQFFKIPQSLEVQKEILQKELDSISENLIVWERVNSQAATTAMYKGLLKRQENLEARLEWIFTKMQKRRDEDVVDFKTMGIDHLLLDESQEFKNLQFDTRYRNVAGLGDPEGSQRALNLLYALRTMQDRKGKDLCATFLTATTISNSLVELYLIFKYLRPRALEAQGIRTFDAWAAVYAKKSSDFEFTVTNEIKSKERFRFFKNVPELATFYNEITNYTTAKDINIEKPESNIVLFTTKSTPEQDEFQKNLIEFARTGKGKLIGRAKDYDSAKSGRMLVVTDLARKAAIDMRLIDPDKYHDHPNNKLSQAAKNIADFYYKYNEQKGTQMVFSDIGTYKPDKWNVYSELKRKLVEDYKIPSHEIRFIQEAKNMKQRDQIKEAFRAGTIRILVGHTKSLGTAMDVPDRGVASHSLNMPWTPKDLEQRDGRLARKGNFIALQYLGNSVDHYLYASENSLDTYMFNLLQNKQAFITQLKTNSLGTRTIDEGAMDSDGTMNYSEYVAILSGNTDLLEKVKLERKVAVLESEFKSHNKQLHYTQSKLQYLLKDLESDKIRLLGMHHDWAIVNEKLPLNENGFRGNPIKLNNFDRNDNLEEIGKKLINIDKKMNTYGAFTEIGSLLNFDILVKTDSIDSYKYNRFYIEGACKYSFNNGDLASDPILAATNFIRALEKIPAIIPNYEENIKKLEKDIKVMEDIVSTPWRKETELNDAKIEVAALDRKIQDALASIGKQENMDNEEVEQEEAITELEPVC
ncbi:N-6 DNA methylase [Dysgonomonas sp. ZJ709]|uniref:N-6 DNA methylase n=1 Tax=Dysgonomonas sp. ZJ709 TaxID=2709797 RepID=UPI0013E9EFD2|nr:N-6 DNA methylase [Dysgonomonas sp. ZJ709]